jgi:glycosyltransferase involved in cell wall biosynthesis
VRILAVTTSAPPHGFGGSDFYAHDLARELAREHDVHLFARAPLAADDPVVSGTDGTVSYTAFASGYSGRDRIARINAAFSALLDRHDPDVVHVHHLGNMPWDIPRLSGARGIAVVFTLHDYWTICQRTFLVDARWQPCPGPAPWRCWGCLSRVPEFEPPAGAFARATGVDARRLLAAAPARLRRRERRIRDMLGHVDLFVSPSHHLRAGLLRHLDLHEDDIVVCPFGIAPVGASPTREAEPRARLRVGFVGSVNFHKGVHVLLDAFAGGLDAELVVYGRVSPAFAAARGDDLRARSCLRGPVDVAARHAMYAAMDVLVLPSVCHENFPLVIAEAFTAGVPVVASNLAGMAEVVRHGIDGLLFRPGDAADLRRMLQALVDDRSLVARLRSGAPAVKSLGAHAAEMVLLFERAQERARRRRRFASWPTTLRPPAPGR